MARQTSLVLAALSGILLFLSWPASQLTALVFVAWIPLLWVESKTKSRSRFFWLTYLTMFIWNVSTTWWIWNASVPGALSAFFANSFLMCLPWFGFRTVKKWFGEAAGYFSLVVFWICFEYIHLQDWGLSWPWLTIGNVFAAHPDWVQWYEYTGVSGGTLWVMTVNVLLFLHLKENAGSINRKNYGRLLVAMAVLILPFFISYVSVKDHAANGETNIIVVQPNIDPYEKISEGTFDAQLQRLIRLSANAIDSATALVIWPETALYMSNGIEENTMKENEELDTLWNFLRQYPQVTLFSGVESYRLYDTLATPTARPLGISGYYFDAFNGSALMDSSGTLGFYHKSMLVPGVETLPWFLKFIDTWFEKFGGTTAGYAKQEERAVLKERRNGFRIAPAICYESIYGEFMAKYIRNGANIICIITNDGWWDNTPGHKQHMHYARLRAVETRKWVARSANTGISCFIDPAGNVYESRPWDTIASIKLNVPAVDGMSFYVRNGDLLSKAATLASIVLLILNIIFRFRKSKNAL